MTEISARCCMGVDEFKRMLWVAAIGRLFNAECGVAVRSIHTARSFRDTPSMKLANRFEILNTLDRGGYGITYRAIDHHHPHQVECVIKELIHTSPRILDMFRREARTLDSIGQHSHIPQLLAYFDQDDKFYIAQELIQGHDLRQEIRPGKRLDEGYVIKLLKDVLSVLAFVHNKGVIHRDIKPANLIRQQSNGDIFLIDFGVVKELSHSQLNHQGRLKTTVKVGSPGYMAPEQAQGKPCYASDLYSVGMLAIAALTEIVPEQLTFNPFTKQVKWSDNSINPALETFIQRLVDANPRQRYANAAEALDALGKTLASIQVGQDSELPTHVAAKAQQPIDTAPVKSITPIPSKLILKVMGGITVVLVMLGFGVKSYQWTAYTLSRRWDAIKPQPKVYVEAQADTLVNLLDDGSVQVRPEVVEPFWRMVSAAQNEGVELFPISGFLSLSEQRKQLRQREDIDIRQWLQQSDYHSGYAIVIGDKNADESTDGDVSFERTDGYRWLKRYAKTYGFELSYPQGNLVGEREPWHWQYSEGADG